jgi:transposase
VRAWLARHKRIHFHFTPTSASWLNQIEIWFGILTRQALRRGSFAAVRTLGGDDRRVHQRVERTRSALRVGQHRR